MARSGYRKKNDSLGSPCAFYTFRTIQFISSCVVAGIMFYFIYRLKHDNFYVPWMFFFLQAAAITTILTIIIGAILKRCWSFIPLYSGLVNGFLFLIWGAGLGLLTNSMRSIILRQCTIFYWGDQTGVYVCISYKLLFTFTVIGTVGTLSTCILDFRITKISMLRGKYERASLGKVENQASGYERVIE